MTEKYAINPLLNDSLNNLAKRLDRSKVPKPSLSKGQSLKKKSKICSSVPNIFYNSEKTNTTNEKNEIQWKNHYTFNVESLRNAFKRNYDVLFIDQKKRSSSIPILSREIDDAFPKPQDIALEETTYNDLEEKNTVDSEEVKSKHEENIIEDSVTSPISNIDADSKIDEKSLPRKLKKSNSSLSVLSHATSRSSRSKEPPKLSINREQEHKTDYLEESIIEPISPLSSASLNKSKLPSQLAEVIKEKSVEITTEKNQDDENKNKPKRGRKKKAPKKKGRPPSTTPKKEFQEKSEVESTEIGQDISKPDDDDQLKDEESREEQPKVENKLEVSIDRVVDNIFEEMKEKSFDSSIEQIEQRNVSQSDNIEVKPIETSIIKQEKPKGKKRGRKPKKKEEKVSEIEVIELPEIEDNKESIIQENKTPQDVSLKESDETDKIVEPKRDVKEMEVKVNYESNQQLEHSKDDSTVEQPQPPPIQLSNELEVVSNSISTESGMDVSVAIAPSTTSSVDTSMLPPRKRYKRYMYLENNKSQNSPKTNSALSSDTVTPTTPDTTTNINTAKTINSESNTVESPNEVNVINEQKSIEKPEVPTDICTDTEIKTASKKTNIIEPSIIQSATKFLSRQKIQTTPTISGRKKKISPLKLKLNRNSSKISKQPIIDNINSVENSEILPIIPPTVEDINEDNSSSSSLKRSKREAAARGFASMVAMSINNSTNNSQIQDNTSETSSKRTTNSLKPPDLESCSSSIINAESINIEIPVKAVKKVKKAKETQSLAKEKPVVKESDSTKKQSKTPKLKKEKIPLQLSPNDELTKNNQIKFRKIRTNTYVDPKPLSWNEEIEKCACKPSRLRHLYEDELKLSNKKSNKISKHTKANKNANKIVWDCNENCLNRVTYTECNQKTCPCSDACGNQKIRKGEWASGLKLVDIEGKGKGVISGNKIKEGTFIIEYVGEVVNENTFHDRMINMYHEDCHHYCLHINGDMLIDAYRCGSLARFINHNCQPNCEMQKWFVNGAYRMCIFATEDIPANTEISYDYNFCSYNNENTQVCLCGSSNCRGYIGSKPSTVISASQKDRMKLYYIFGKRLNPRDKLFITRTALFLHRNWELGRCKRLGIKNPRLQRGANKLPSGITEIKRRKDKKNQFLTQMSALNSIRSIRTRQLHSAQDNEFLTRIAQLGQILRDLYNSLLEIPDPDNSKHQLVAPFIKSLNRKKYPEFYRMITLQGAGNDRLSKNPFPVTSLNEICKKLQEGRYESMLEFDKDVLTILYNIEMYAGKQSSVGRCADRIKSCYRDLKFNSIALYEVLSDQTIDEKTKSKLTSNNLYSVSLAVAVLKGAIDNTQNLSEEALANPSSNIFSNVGTGVGRKRKQANTALVPSVNTNVVDLNAASIKNMTATNVAELSIGNFPRNRLERGAEVIKCVCGFLVEANHIMVQCDQCFVWQHAACMNVARSNNKDNKDVICDVTRQEPYYCHVCLGIPAEELEREIPRSYIIASTEEQKGADDKDDKTLFWTLWADNQHQNLLKIDDFVRVKNKEDDLYLIMRIYSLWKDKDGKKWMEGGLFVRPYDKRIQTIDKIETSNNSNNAKGNKSRTRGTGTHSGGSNQPKLFHKQELIYTEISEIISLDDYRLQTTDSIHVLNPHTYKQGRPIESKENCVFICDWMVNGDDSELASNQVREWSELDPNYLKINVKPYCFNKLDQQQNQQNYKFERIYSIEELKELDKGVMSHEEFLERKGLSPKPVNAEIDKREQQQRYMQKLLEKLHEFAKDRNQKLPSGSSSPANSSSNSSCASSPVLEQNNSTSSRRKQPFPIKREPGKLTLRKRKPVARSPSIDQSPQLVIVTEEANTEGNTSPKTDENASTPKATTTTTNTEEYSNLGSEINFGDLAEILKDKQDELSIQKEEHNPVKLNAVRGKRNSQDTSNVKPPIPVKKTKKQQAQIVLPIPQKTKNSSTSLPPNPNQSNRKLRTRPPKRTQPTPDSDSDDYEVMPTKIRETIQDPPIKKTKVEVVEKESVTTPVKPIVPIDTSEDSKTESKLTIEEPSIDVVQVVDDSDDTKDCFVKLERMKVKNSSEYDKEKTAEGKDDSFVSVLDDASIQNQTTILPTTSVSDSNINPITASNPTNSNPNLNVSSNRSKRKKGVPKRIPLDSAAVKPVNNKELENQTDSIGYEAVDLTRCTNTCDNNTVINPLLQNQAKSSENIASSLPPTVVVTAPKPATNDFSSIENISSSH